MRLLLVVEGSCGGDAAVDMGKCVCARVLQKSGEWVGYFKAADCRSVVIGRH
jgi:hypothetical protein